MSAFRLFVVSAFAVSLFACSNATTSGGQGGGTASQGGGTSSSQGGGAQAGGQGGGNGGGSSGAEVCNDLVDNDGDGFVDCADSDCFQNVSCFASCADLCTDGAAICDGSGLRTCEVDSTTGCRKFGGITACTGALLCSGGSCVATCSNQCVAGAKQCSNTGGVVTCQTLTSGCTDWVGPMMCQSGDVCSGGACVPRAQCMNQCTAGTTRCTTGGQVQTCVAQTGGCTDWAFAVNCAIAGQSCTAPATACAAPVRCTTGDKRCASGAAPAVETCDTNGTWTMTASCPQACASGACTANATCTAGTVRCNGTNVERCNASGTAWLYNQTCNLSCTGGLCNDPCTAGEKRCNAKTPETCNTGGTGWTAAQTCATDCYLGDCMATDLLVDGVTTTLEGDLAFANSVIVRNNGHLKVGPSGVLKIRAHTISVDAVSDINANDVGDDTRGEGGTNTCCAYNSGGVCRCPITGPSGSAYGTAGTSSTAYTTLYCSYYGGSPGCYLPGSGGAVYDRTDDLSISEGSKLGTAKGGGLVKLVADSIDIKGQVTATSTNAGASGGGIFLAADTITGTGLIQASGGSPSGGNGRVKVLRGATNSFTGTITGAQSVSPMPPLDLVSGSHPNPARWYNDGLGDLFLAWSKPFSSLNGYYYKVSTDPALLPSQTAGNGTFLQAETFVVPAAQLVQGANYFHIVSVDSGFNVGSVKNTMKVSLNTQPPTIASSSHPAQRTWYANPALYFTWTNPQADENFTGYYYTLDHFLNGLPPTTSTNFTTNKQILLANTTDGIWVLHLLNRDTRNAVTKVAANYVVYVGTEPAKGNLTGVVTDASNNSMPMTGVTISVNRGLFNQTSLANGTYTFAGNLYVGTWEVTASKTGYMPQTKMVTITAGGMLSENFSLTVMP